MPYNIQGNEVRLGAEPFARNGTHYVPLRDVVRALGGAVTLKDRGKTAIATIGQWTATVQNANRNLDVSGTPVLLSAEPFLEDGRMYVPFDFFHDAYGYSLSMAGDTLNITNPNA